MTLPSRKPADVLVRFAGVNKSYDGMNLAVRDLDLEVRRGEFLSLLGASGSGKTTTLMMLAGFERPTSGSIELAGKPLENVPPWQRDIGIVFQSYALFPHMTVFQNIAFPLKQRRRAAADIERRVREMLSLVKLEGLQDRLPAQLSGGQQQRVALARALVFEPQLVLMDEPLGALDKRLREHMQLELKRIHARVGVTIVYVTHDQGEALAMSDRIAVFADGRIRQLAAPSELYEQPTDALVADFVGENNRIEGTLEMSAGDYCRVRFDERFHVIHGVISGVVYLGDHARIEITLPGGRTLSTRLSNDAGRIVPLIGEAVTISWRTEDCHVFFLQDRARDTAGDL
jgi:putative spermidine/putrescine transport system ATP-binding protein